MGTAFSLKHVSRVCARYSPLAVCALGLSQIHRFDGQPLAGLEREWSSIVIVLPSYESMSSVCDAIAVTAILVPSESDMGRVAIDEHGQRRRRQGVSGIIQRQRTGISKCTAAAAHLPALCATAPQAETSGVASSTMDDRRMFAGCQRVVSQCAMPLRCLWTYQRLISESACDVRCKYSEVSRMFENERAAETDDEGCLRVSTANVC